MPKSFTEILGKSGTLNESVQAELNEAFETRIAEERENLTAELREEFATRYENDKSQIVEAMDALLQNTIRTELNEFAQDRKNVVAERVKYRKAVKEHAKVLDRFITETLSKEIRELHEDRTAQKANFGKLEEFVLRQLSKELNEFHDDKRALVEQKVKMVKEGKKVIAEAKRDFVKKSAAKVEKMIEGVLTGELTALREDVQRAKENDFGRQIFEAFASEFMTSTLSENTETAKLAKQIVGLKHNLAESKQVIAEKEIALTEATRNATVARDLNKRKAIMSEMLDPLNPSQKELMGTLLESVKTVQLKAAYNKYLPTVLSEEAGAKTQVTRQAKLTENKTANKRAVSGDKANRRIQQDAGGTAGIIELKKLAGLS